MSAPALDDTCRLEAIPQPIAHLCAASSKDEHGAGGKTLDLDKILALVKQALELYKSSSQWPQGKTFRVEHDSVIDVSKGKAAQAQQKSSTPEQARLAKCAWHARRSVHDPNKQSHKLGYNDFYQGLAVDHPPKEKEYIHDMLRYEKVSGEAADLQVPSVQGTRVSHSISTMRADVWISEYTTPPVTSNRDFCELFFTVEFQPHHDPLSPEHIDAIIADIDGKGTSQQDPSPSGRRSCINIQYPVSTNDCAPQANFVRAFYASVEVLRELENDGTEWWMAVQSDTAGKLPLMFQEMAMPSKIAPDVPSFIGWAVKDKEKRGK